MNKIYAMLGFKPKADPVAPAVEKPAPKAKTKTRRKGGKK